MDGSEPQPETFILLRVNNIGGAELSLLTLAKGLKAAGHRVSLVAYGTRPDLLAVAGGPEVIRLPSGRTLTAAIPLYRLLRRRRPATLIAALYHTNLLAIAISAAARRGIRVVVTEHNPLAMTFPRAVRVRYRFMRSAMRFIYPFAAAVVVVSRGIAAEIARVMPDTSRLRIIYNPAVPKKGDLSSPPPHPWLADRRVPVVMGIGRLDPAKNFPLLLRAFARVAARRPVRLVILGEGAQRPQLEALRDELGIADRVLMPGLSDNVPDWLRHAAVCVCSSNFEGFGNVLVEAMACRVPVVSTNCPVGPDEILDGGRFGRLVPVDDPVAMAAAIEDVLDCPGDLDAAENRTEQFTVERCVTAYGALIRDLTHQVS